MWATSWDAISFWPGPPAVSSPQAATAGPPSRRPHHFRDAGLEYVLAVPAGSIQRLTAGAAAFIRKAIEAAPNRAFRTLKGRSVSIGGPPPPKTVRIVQWDSVDDAV